MCIRDRLLKGPELRSIEEECGIFGSYMRRHLLRHQLTMLTGNVFPPAVSSQHGMRPLFTDVSLEDAKRISKLTYRWSWNGLMNNRRQFIPWCAEVSTTFCLDAIDTFQEAWERLIGLRTKGFCLLTGSLSLLCPCDAVYCSFLVCENKFPCACWLQSSGLFDVYR